MADDNKPLKYMRYAIGEIVLVVIGILIALQINTWNEEQKTQQRLTDFLAEIQNNLSNDILAANYLIDEYINRDSILRNIKHKKVIYTLDNHVENRQSFTFIFEFESFRLQTKGFDGLVQNIDNIPKKYTELIYLLNFVYVTNNYDLETFNQRVMSNSYTNKDKLKNKDWSSDFWDWELNDEMIEYFQSNQYINDARHYFNDLRDFILYVIKFKIAAIDAYIEISKLNSAIIPIPKHVNYYFPNPEILSQFAGDFRIEYKENLTEDDETQFLIDKNQLQWHYSYKDVNHDEEFNVNLYWHKNYVFFNTMSAAIWEFNITDEDDITYTGRFNGNKDHYIKTTKD